MVLGMGLLEQFKPLFVKLKLQQKTYIFCTLFNTDLSNEFGNLVTKDDSIVGLYV